jgi:ferritin
MISKKINEAFSNQINAEMYSSYLYLAMAAWFESTNLKGFARWMRLQAQEEMSHAMKFFDHMVERGGKVALAEITAPPAKWDSPLAVFEDAYKHECKVSSLINNLADLAVGAKDHASGVFLQWFINEQVEEEAAAYEIVQKLKMTGERSSGLFMLDRILGERKAED